MMLELLLLMGELVYEAAEQFVVEWHHRRCMLGSDSSPECLLHIRQCRCSLSGVEVQISLNQLQAGFLIRELEPLYRRVQPC